MANGGEFEAIVSTYHRQRWDRHPTEGSAVGLREFDDRLETPSRDAVQDDLAAARTTMAAIEALPAPPAGTDEELDRMAFSAHLALADLELAELQRWRKDPSLAPQVAIDALFELLMRRDVSRPETVAAIVRRMERFGDYHAAARERIDDPILLWVTVAESTIEGGMAFLKEAIAPLGARHPQLQAELTSALDNAVAAMGRYLAWVRSLKGRHLNPDLAAGPGALQRIVHHGHGLGLSLDQVEAIGHDQIRHYRAELSEQAKAIDPDRSWESILDQARTDFGSRPRKIVEEYRSVTDRLRDRLVAEEILELPPGERCRVIPTPAYLKAVIPTAAYSSPGPLDENQVGLFFVSEPDPPPGTETYRANLGQHWGIELTAGHEAYPGHHVQLCWANRSPSLARKMASHIIFMEGWTLYCEQMLTELGWFDSPTMKLSYLADQLWRAYRVVIDVGVHRGSMSVASAVTALMEGIGATRERAQTELNWYTQRPGTPMSYLLGKRETLALREGYMKRPGATLKEFHRWLLSFGSIPQRWLWPHL